MGWFNSFFGVHQAAVKEDATMLDVVTYVASLASNPKEIDPILDKVRAISSQLEPGESLSSADEAVLSKVYKSVERYLIAQDPIRKFSAEELHRRIHTRFPNIKAQL